MIAELIAIVNALYSISLIDEEEYSEAMNELYSRKYKCQT